MDCSKWECDTRNPSHMHVDTREESPYSIGEKLWEAAGDASISEMLAGGTIEEVVALTVKFLCSKDNDGGLRLVDFDDELLGMDDYLTVYLESEKEE